MTGSSGKIQGKVKRVRELCQGIQTGQRGREQMQPNGSGEMHPNREGTRGHSDSKEEVYGTSSLSEWVNGTEEGHRAVAPEGSSEMEILQMATLQGSAVQGASVH